MVNDENMRGEGLPMDTDTWLWLELCQHVRDQITDGWMKVRERE